MANFSIALSYTYDMTMNHPAGTLASLTAMSWAIAE